MRLRSYLTSAAAAAAMALLASNPAAAAPITFTWNPGAIIAGTGTISNVTNFNINDFATITLLDNAGNFQEQGALQVLGFLNGNSTVLTPQLGTNYSLFYVFNGTGNQGGPIPTTLNTTTTGTFSTLNYSLYISPTGAPTFQLDGSNNAASPILLATGSLVPGGGTVSLTDTLTGLTAHADILVTLDPCTSLGDNGGVCTGNEGAFFQDPNATTAVLQVGDFGATSSVTTTGPCPKDATKTCVFINGGGGNITETLAPVPEPVTMSVFGAGLLGAAFLRRRKAQKA